MPKIVTPAANSVYVPMVIAAADLGLTKSTMRRIVVDRGEFTQFRPNGPSKGAAIYLSRAEVKAFSEGQLEGLREFRARKGKTAKKKT